MASEHKTTQLPLLLADATLGRLCKWLRMIGIDAQMDAATPDPQRLEGLSKDNCRWVLTRSRKVFDHLGSDRCLMLRYNAPVEQIRQVLRYFKIRHFDLVPLSRCIQCNRSLTKAGKQEVIGKIPDHVWQSNAQFMTCDQCRRIYWPGTHAGRMHSMIDQWFQQE